MTNSFDKIRYQAEEEWKALNEIRQPLILVGTATCGRSAGSLEVLETFHKQLKKRNINCTIMETGCIGLCYAEPIVFITIPSMPTICYGNVTPKKAKELVLAYLINKNPMPEYALGTIGDVGIKGIPRLFDTPVLKLQVRRTLRNCGFIDPTNVNHYLANKGYAGLTKAFNMSAEDVIEQIKKSGLRGRGGAGFPTWRKWQFCREAEEKEKYIICNADEGDPGAFMNRSLIEGDPHSILEGMLIAGYAIGAKEGYIYCRVEYPLALERLRLAIRQAEESGLLKNNILGSGFSFNIHVKVGAGAFVCGEETALIASIEGNRGMPRPRPPFPASSGLWSKPTIINNVETLASVALIMQNGADWFTQYGTEKSKGTKTFSLVGKIKRTGLVEVPFGTTLRQMIYDIGGGVLGDKQFKAVQTGGPSGGCIPGDLLDTPVDYDSLKAAWTIMGSGGMVVMDEDTCMVDFARYFLDFTEKESCGKCVPCRLGTKQMLEILKDITVGKGREEDIDLLLELAEAVKVGSLCGLGQTAPNPVLTTIRYFRDEYQAHVERRECIACVCKEIISSPCQHICPIDTEAPVYISLIAQKRFKKAFEIILKDNPLPSVCGRVCHHPCELKCQAGKWADPIAIRALKRFAVDYALKNRIYPRNKKKQKKKGKKIAIIGSGPSGLSAGYYLSNKGYNVTIFEELDTPGGGLAVYIPEYRLPKEILKADIKNITNSGVEIKTNTRIGRDITFEKLVNDYKAVFIATGAHKARNLHLENEGAEGVIDAMEFLKDVNCNKKVNIGGRVGVIGGGNVAVDAARSAARIKDCEKVFIIYRRTEKEMPAFREEIDALLQEGIEIQFLQAPVRIMTENKKVTGVECIRMQLGEVDKSGRRKPIPVKGSESLIPLDTLLVAIGEEPDLSFIGKGYGIKTAKNGTLVVDPETLAANSKGIFAGGDVVTGPNTVTDAVLSGKIAAEMIDKYIKKEKLVREYKLTRPSMYVDPIELTEEEIEESQKFPVPRLAIRKRINNFNEVDLDIPQNQAIKEGRRCLRCDLETEDAKNLVKKKKPRGR